MEAVATRTREEKAGQLRELESAIVGGQDAADAIRQHVKKHNLSLKCGRADFAQLMLRWSRQGRFTRSKSECAFGLALLRAGMLFRKAMERDDLHTALEAERLTCDLLNLYAPAVTRMTTCSAG